jgi:hypothetical protein
VVVIAPPCPALLPCSPSGLKVPFFRDNEADNTGTCAISADFQQVGQGVVPPCCIRVMLHHQINLHLMCP